MLLLQFTEKRHKTNKKIKNNNTYEPLAYNTERNATGQLYRMINR